VSDPPPPLPPPADNRLSLGALSIGGGILLAALSGTCTVSAMWIGFEAGDKGGFAITAMICGALPIGLGIALILLGRHLRNEARRASPRLGRISP
jgi:hypothetical protein